MQIGPSTSDHDTTSVSDPKSRGENLLHNYHRVVEIGPRRCNGCERYHVNWPLYRLANFESPYGSDHRELEDAIGRILVPRAAKPDTLTITIVGSADTALLALMAHAAWKAGLLERSEFHVIDQCDTPLQLCRDYGEQNKLRVFTAVKDVMEPDPGTPSDLIIVHSLLRFIPDAQRRPCLHQWAGWLKPGGRLVVSNTYAPVSGRESRSFITEGLRELVARDGIALAEPKERFLERLEHRPHWPVTSVTEKELRELYRDDALHVENMNVVRIGDAKGRILAVFRSASDNGG